MSACRFGTKPGGTAAKKCVLLFSLLWKNQRAFLFSPAAAARLFFTANHRPYTPKEKRRIPMAKQLEKVYDPKQVEDRTLPILAG